MRNEKRCAFMFILFYIKTNYVLFLNGSSTYSVILFSYSKYSSWLNCKIHFFVQRVWKNIVGVFREMFFFGVYIYIGQYIGIGIFFYPLYRHLPLKKMIHLSRVLPSNKNIQHWFSHWTSAETRGKIFRESSSHWVVSKKKKEPFLKYQFCLGGIGSWGWG